MRKASNFITIILLTLFCSCIYVYADSGTSTRTLPSSYTPGVPFDVTISVVPTNNVIIYGVEETPPQGWTVTNINESGNYASGTIRWIFFDKNPRTLTYRVTPPIGQSGEKIFSGIVTFNSTEITIGGDLIISNGGTPPINYTLNVNKIGTGSGTVTSNPSGINCGSICSASFNQNTQVTLTATPLSGSTFAGWSGDCSGSSTTCTVTMNSAKNITPTFSSTMCNYSIAPMTANITASGGSSTVSVTATAGCPWTAVSNASWITITSGSSGAGNGTVSYSVSQNTGTSSRTGTITIAGQTHTVTQNPNGGSICNIVGTWTMNYKWDCYGSNSSVGTFVLNYDGTISNINDVIIGRWTLSVDQIHIIFSDDTKDVADLIGTVYSSCNNMSGTMTNLVNYATGCWSAVLSNRLPVFRFYNTYTGGHFFTDNPDERNMVIRDLPDFRWESDGAYYIYRTQQSGTSPVYRLFNTYGVGHYYTISESDKDAKIAQGYALERVGFYAFTTQVGRTKPVYYFNRPASTNNGKEAWFYTISEAEKNLIITTMPVWVYKGIAFYAYEN